MKKQAPSIFNDVIGPIMRGPSSSHVAAAARIGEMLLQAAGNNLSAVEVEFDCNGALAESHDGHGTDMGFACGIMGLPLTDPRVGKYWELIRKRGIDLRFLVADYGAKHPNYYRMTARGSGGAVRMDAISTGGGMIEVVFLEGFAVSMEGDYYEDCYMIDQAKEAQKAQIEQACRKHVAALEKILFSDHGGYTLAEIKSSEQAPNGAKAWIRDFLKPHREYHFAPVLPTISSARNAVPFRTATELLRYNEKKQLPLWKLAVLYESKRGNVKEEKVLEQMEKIVDIMANAAETGRKGTVYADRILPAQAMKMDDATVASRLVPGPVMNRVIQYISAIMEAKSAMHVIVAAPTAGACGCLPGTILGMAEAMGKTKEEIVQAMLAAGLVGVFFADEATFAAEVGGCQMECGAGSGMAAAGVVQLIGGSAEECLDAASVALQGLTGLACDPVANRVEVPCLNKNVVGGMNALSSANMILSGFDKVIPLDETIAAMYDIGLQLPLELRCTFGGLGKTKTALNIRRTLASEKEHEAVSKRYCQNG